jgi:hypothetical protein
MRRLPDKIASSDPFAVAFNQLIDCIEERTPKNSNTVKVQRLGTGFAMHAAPASTPTETPGNFKGEWTGQAYSAGDEVKISNGIEAGTYIAINDTPAPPPGGIPANWPYLPWAGSSWVLKGRVNDQSSWI